MNTGIDSIKPLSSSLVSKYVSGSTKKSTKKAAAKKSTKTYLSAWVDKDEAKALRDKLVAEGKYAKGEVKLTSYRFKNGKDNTDGYLARVVEADKKAVAKKPAVKKAKKPAE